MRKARPAIPWIALVLSAFFAFSGDAHAKRKNPIKEVVIEWEEIAGAKHYELWVEKAGKVIIRKSLKDVSWTGKLAFGQYAYKIRAVDKVDRPGGWSELEPLVVMPTAPDPVFPVDGAQLVLFDSKVPTVLKWSAVEGVTYYRVEVKKDGKTFLNKSTKEARLDLGELGSGGYRWTIRSVVESSGAFKGRRWEGQPSDSLDFTVEQRTLARPIPVFPLDTILPPAKNRLTLKWKPVDGAEAYEVRLVTVPSGNRGQQRAIASRLEKGRAYVTKETSFTMIVPREGDYAWQVRALASVSPKNIAAVRGPESTSEFQLDRNLVFTDGNGYIAISTMIAPYVYRALSPSTNSVANTASNAITLRLSGEYWFRPRWGASVGAEQTTFNINNQYYNRLSFEFLAKYRMSLSRDQFGWFLAPKAGPEFREYFELTDPSLQGTDIQNTKATALGMTLGLDIRKQFSTRWSLGIKMSYFYPLTVSGLPSGSALTGDASGRNMSLGAQVLYWLSSRWGLSAGGYFENRSISFMLPGQTESEEVYMDGSYFFGSLIWTFGH